MSQSEPKQTAKPNCPRCKELAQLLSAERRQHNATRQAWQETIAELEELKGRATTGTWPTG
jgi:hypothetical protein